MGTACIFSLNSFKVSFWFFSEGSIRNSTYLFLTFPYCILFVYWHHYLFLCVSCSFKKGFTVRQSCAGFSRKAPWFGANRCYALECLAVQDSETMCKARMWWHNVQYESTQSPCYNILQHCIIHEKSCELKCFGNWKKLLSGKTWESWEAKVITVLLLSARQEAAKEEFKPHLAAQSFALQSLAKRFTVTNSYVEDAKIEKFFQSW